MARGFLLRAQGKKKEALADFQAFLRYNGPELHGQGDLVRRWVGELKLEVDSTDEMPLSDMMANHDGTNDAYLRILEEFRHSIVGVIAVGAPDGTVGQFQSTSQRSISLRQTTHAGGRRMILAFADPPAFARRFGAQFNAEMSGRE